MPETQTQAVYDTPPSMPTNSSVPLKCKGEGGGAGRRATAASVSGRAQTLNSYTRSLVPTQR